MPLINIKLMENVFSAKKKKQLIERITDTMVEFEGEKMRSVTWVIIEEVQSGSWGIGGEARTITDVKKKIEST